MNAILVFLALQQPEGSDPSKSFRARARIEIASKVRDATQLLEGNVFVRPGESLVAELRDENRRRIRLDFRPDAPPPERFFVLDLWRRTDLHERYEWRPEQGAADTVPEAVVDARGHARPPTPMKLGLSARVAGEGTDRFEASRSFVLTPRDGKAEKRTIRVALDRGRLVRAVVDAPDGTVTCILSGFREAESLDGSAPDLDSEHSEERR